MGYRHGAEELSGKSDPVPALTQPDFLKETKKEYHLRLGVVDTKKTQVTALGCQKFGS